MSTPGRRLFDTLRAKAKELGRKLDETETVLEMDRFLSAQTKERKKASTIPEADQVYELYPRKVGPLEAKIAISKALKSNELAYLLDKTSQFAEAVRSWPSSYRYKLDGGDLCPNPATWFNRGSYADDPKEWRRFGARNNGPQKVQVAAPEGWREWIETHLPSEDDACWGQVTAALNCNQFSMLPSSWQSRCREPISVTQALNEVQ